jgi:protein involved in polysaccharide export with SLBB domain
MLAGEGGSSWGTRQRRSLGLLLVLLSGCAAPSQQVEHALMADKPAPVQNEALAEHYRIGCPDVLEVAVPARSELNGRYRVAADGRIDLGKLGRLRVEGRTAVEAATQIAQFAGLPSSAVLVRVVEFNSQQVYLMGEVHGLQRAIPYEGPERVGALLQRAGGLAPGAALGQVHVVRSHVIDGRAPEVFQVDLQAIVMKHDTRTNIVLQPFDEIHVGETPQSTLARSMPPVLLPFYEGLFGLRPKQDERTFQTVSEPPLPARSAGEGPPR